jgi:hypothetical protein
LHGIEHEKGKRRRTRAHQEIPKSRYSLVFSNRVGRDTEEESKTPQAPSITRLIRFSVRKFPKLIADAMRQSTITYRGADQIMGHRLASLAILVWFSQSNVYAPMSSATM